MISEIKGYHLSNNKRWNQEERVQPKQGEGINWETDPNVTFTKHHLSTSFNIEEWVHKNNMIGNINNLNTKDILILKHDYRVHFLDTQIL